jgi:hypothetical protein
MLKTLTSQIVGGRRESGSTSIVVFLPKVAEGGIRSATLRVVFLNVNLLP